jgi:hypothetical protein
MCNQRRFVITAALCVLSFCGAAAAAELKQVATIPIPGEPLISYEISYIDQAGQKLYLADRSNKGVDVYDLAANKFAGRVEGFIGAVILLKGGCVGQQMKRATVPLARGTV